jgi:uncharacterized membrane protein
MLMIRRIIVIFIGSLFFVPAIVLIVLSFTKADISSDDMYAMWFVALLLGVAGITLWWVAYDMRHKAKKDSDLTAIGLANMSHISNMDDTFDDSL